MQTIVFLDRDSLDATIRPPSFAHAWRDWPATSAAEVAARLADATIAITNKIVIRAEALDQLPRLRMIAVAATGTDIVDVGRCHERGVVVSNIRNYATASLPEHVFALLLALRRNLVAYRADVEAGRWQQATTFCLASHPIGDLAGSTIGIVGFGALGRSVARIAIAFGLRVVVFDPFAAPDPAVDFMPLDDLLGQADIVTLHLPLTLDTRHMIGARELARMKPTAILINTARGGLVDEGALAAALTSGRLAGAGFDVLTEEPPRAGNPLLDLRLPNFILTPHVAWASREAQQSLADQLVDNLEAFVTGSPRNVV